MRVSVVIPCGPTHVKNLAGLVSNLKNGTVPPDEIVIAVSEIDPSVARALSEELQEIFPLTKVLDSTQRIGPGANRNRAVLETTGDIISFIDADDTNHPQKIEIVKYVFDKWKPAIFL